MNVLLRRRMMMQTAAPPAPVIPYQQIEYIEGTGQQYINLDYKPSSSTDVQIDLLWPFERDKEILGAREDTSTMYEFLYARAGSYNVIYYQYGAASPNYRNFTSSQRNIFASRQNVFLINGEQVMTATAQTFSTNVDLYLFALNNNGSIQRIASAKVYSVKIVENGVTIRDMVPVRDGQTGYLYDIISETLFGNAGSGSFTLGQDK